MLFLERGQPLPRVVQNRGRHPRQLRHFDAVALACRAVADGMQEDDLALMLHGVEMHVRRAFHFGRQPGELEIVGGEQGEGADVPGDVVGGGPGQRQPVVGAGATAYLVEEHQAVGGGVAQDVRGLAHLHHEGGTAAGQVVGRADAREDAIQRADGGCRGGHEAAGVGEQGDQRRLPHVGGFAAHIRAGHHQHAAALVQRQVVGHEGRIGLRLHHRMPPGFDDDGGFGGKRGARQAVALGGDGERMERIQPADLPGGLAQGGQAFAELLEKALEQQPLALQRLGLAGERFVLELLELGHDVALGVLERLAPNVLRGHLSRRVPAGFDVVAVDAVEAHLEIGEPGALAFPGFEGVQPLGGVFRKVLEAVQLGVEALGDEAAFAQRGRWLFHQSAVQQHALVVEGRQRTEAA